MTDADFNARWLADVKMRAARLCQHDTTRRAPVLDIDRAPGERDDDWASPRECDREAARVYGGKDVD